MPIVRFHDNSSIEVPKRHIPQRGLLAFGLASQRFSNAELQQARATFQSVLPTGVTTAKWGALLFAGCALFIDADPDLMMAGYLAFVIPHMVIMWLITRFLQLTQPLTKQSLQSVRAELAPSRERKSGRFIQKYLATMEKEGRTMRIYDTRVLYALASMAKEESSSAQPSIAVDPDDKG